MLAAHETPPEYRDDRQAYLDVVCNEIIPAVGGSQDWPDSATCFAKRACSRPMSRDACWKPEGNTGLAPRLHADEFVDSGGAELAAELGALSADHLIAVSPAGIEAMAGPA